jgi:hypothetical protein
MLRYFFINQFPIKNREFKMRVRWYTIQKWQQNK